jgi:hypothetical protein
MKYKFDYAVAAKIIMALIIGVVFFYTIFSMIRFGDGHTERSAGGIKEIIDRALVQCYALEGMYPTSLEYITRYGVILDEDRYIYHYEWYGSNLHPNVIVVER